MTERVFVTGVGAVTPCGADVAESWQAIRSGTSGVSLLSDPGFDDLPVRIGGRIDGFDPERLVPRSDVRRLDRHQLLAVAACAEALDGGLPGDRERIGVISASSAGAAGMRDRAVQAVADNGPRRVPIGVTLYGGVDGAATYIAERYGLHGSAQGVSATCASGAVALGQAMRMIRHGYLDAVCVVGADACLTRVNLAANAVIGALARGHEDAPELASRPFDQARNGFVIAEGAAALLLESERSARARGADVLGEVAGYGATSDAHHPTAPHPEGAGAARAIGDALRDARVQADEIDYVNAHGTGTRANDTTELIALRRALGDRAASVPISSTKGATGHLLGAAGTFEAIVGLLSMRDGVAPPTANLDDPEATEFEHVRGSARPLTIRAVLSNSFGFGGHNASVVLRAVDG